MITLDTRTAEQGLIGTSPPRLDAWEKVTGRVLYAGDMTMPGMLHARILWSAHAHALIRSIDTTAARALPGVHAVLTHEDVPGSNRYGVAVLDQRVLAGVGNIYSCEALWHAKISPFRLANSLKPNETKALYKAIVSTLRRALQLCLNPPPDFSDAEWWFQGIEGILRVYQREDEPCKRDGHPIKRTTKGNRSTYFCAHCQK